MNQFSTTPALTAYAHCCAARAVGWVVSLVFYLLCVCCVGAEPTDPRALPAARDILRTLDDLAHRDDGAFLIGQNLGSSNYHIEQGMQRFGVDLSEQTGRWPAILSVDYGYNQMGPGIPATNRLLIEHWQRGGLVALSMHPANPWHGSRCDDLRVGPIDHLLQPGTDAHRRWLGTLDRVAKGLAELQQAGVVVMWRPLHEMNGDWFWWSCAADGRGLSTAEFQRLWQQMHRYLTEERSLHNLLWVYSPSVTYQARMRSEVAAYPGDAWVDIVSLDYYGDPKAKQLGEALQRVSRLNKPMGIAEFGFDPAPSSRFDNLALIRGLRAHPVRPTFVSYWHSWEQVRMAIVDHHQADSLMKHPQVITREQLPSR